MICRTLGRSGINVSAIALGCEGFSAKSHEEARGIMNFAGANDIHFIDACASDPECARPSARRMRKTLSVLRSRARKNETDNRTLQNVKEYSYAHG